MTTPSVGVSLAGVPGKIFVKGPIGDVSAAQIDRTLPPMTLTLLDSTVAVQPGTVRALVSGGPAAGTAYFFFGGSTPAAHFQTAALDEGGGASVSLVITNRPVGSSIIIVGSTSVLPAQTAENSEPINITGAPPPTEATVVTAVPPMPPEAPVNHWVFQAYDFSSGGLVSTYTLPINPDRLDMSYGEFVIDHENTTVSNGRIVAWEGAPVPNIWRWSGAVLDEASYGAMVAIGTTGQRLYLTDHFRRRFLVKVASVSMQRVRDLERPWHHRYEMTAWILSGAGVVV